MNKNNKINKRLKRLSNAQDELWSLKSDITDLERTIRTLRESTRYRFVPYYSEERSKVFNVKIEPPYETKEQEIIEKCKNDLIRFYTNQKRRLLYKANKMI